MLWPIIGIIYFGICILFLSAVYVHRDNYSEIDLPLPLAPGVIVICIIVMPTMFFYNILAKEAKRAVYINKTKAERSRA